MQNALAPKPKIVLLNFPDELLMKICLFAVTSPEPVGPFVYDGDALRLQKHVQIHKENGSQCDQPSDCLFKYTAVKWNTDAIPLLSTYINLLCVCRRLRNIVNGESLFHKANEFTFYTSERLNIYLCIIPQAQNTAIERVTIHANCISTSPKQSIFSLCTLPHLKHLRLEFETPASIFHGRMAPCFRSNEQNKGLRNGINASELFQISGLESFKFIFVGDFIKRAAQYRFALRWPGTKEVLEKEYLEELMAAETYYRKVLTRPKGSAIPVSEILPEYTPG